MAWCFSEVGEKDVEEEEEDEGDVCVFTGCVVEVDEEKEEFLFWLLFMSGSGR